MQRWNSIRALSFLLFFTCVSCATYEPFYSERVENWQTEVPDKSVLPDYSVFLLGGSGNAYTSEAVLSLLEEQLAGAGENSAAIFLGNQVYPNGLPDTTHRTWEKASESLAPQLRILENYPGELILIPGIHDWAGGRTEGLEYVRNQRKYVEDYLDKKKIFLPPKEYRYCCK